MNYRLVSKYLGHFAFALGLLMLPSALCAVCFQDWGTLAAFFVSFAMALAAGLALTFFGRQAPNQMYQREGLALVSASWFVAAGIGALPYLFAGVLGPVDAFFESMSGFTTTGSTVLENIEAVPKSILFWRSFTQWVGGMGIVVLFIAVLPYLGAGGKQLFKSETPGPDPRALSPRIKDTAKILWWIYLGLTVVETAALWGVGMTFYEALCHTFSTLATGGFSTQQASIAGFNSVAMEIIIMFFMVCAGTNFALFFAMLRKDWKAPFKDTEWRIYVAVLLVATLLITLNLLFGEWSQPQDSGAAPGLGAAFRHASFQVVSITTTTGFGTANFDAWPQFSRMLLVALMFIGGCAGSTGGGIKVARLIMLIKMAYWRLEFTFRPKTVRMIRIGDAVVDDDVQQMVHAFFVIYILWFVVGSLFMALLGLPFQTAFSSVAATLNNIGPGLELIGATHDFSHVPVLGKLFLTLCMVMGRLEIFSVCVLFIPAFWRHSGWAPRAARRNGLK